MNKMIGIIFLMLLWSMNCIDLCLKNTSCESCLAEEDCGFCMNYENPEDPSFLCVSKGSNGSAPAGVNCTVWYVELAQCFLAQNCYDLLDCNDCLLADTCGWCNSTGACLPGNSTGPFDATCPEELSLNGTVSENQWFFNESQCPANPAFCAQFNGNCTSCVSYEGCGYCATTDDCLALNSVDPDECQALRITSCADPCQVPNITCAECTVMPYCGWCVNTGCFNGNSTGPFFNVTCPVWLIEGECESCKQYLNCKECIQNPVSDCDWCFDNFNTDLYHVEFMNEEENEEEEKIEKKKGQVFYHCQSKLQRETMDKTWEEEKDLSSARSCSSQYRYVDGCPVDFVNCTLYTSCASCLDWVDFCAFCPSNNSCTPLAEAPASECYFSMLDCPVTPNPVPPPPNEKDIVPTSLTSGSLALVLTASIFGFIILLLVAVIIYWCIFLKRKVPQNK